MANFFQEYLTRVTRRECIDFTAHRALTFLPDNEDYHLSRCCGRSQVGQSEFQFSERREVREFLICHTSRISTTGEIGADTSAPPAVAQLHTHTHMYVH